MSDVVTALRAITLTACREWNPDTANICGAQAEFVLWGKLIPPEGLGPRCYDCAAKHIDWQGLSPNSGYALIDLRPALAALESSAAALGGQESPAAGSARGVTERTTPRATTSTDGEAA